jgi:hypothetical protein
MSKSLKALKMVKGLRQSLVFDSLTFSPDSLLKDVVPVTVPPKDVQMVSKNDKYIRCPF